MPDPAPRTLLRVGSYSIGTDMLRRLLERHPQRVRALFEDYGEHEAELPRIGAAWAARQAVLRALAAPPRIAGRWDDVQLRSAGDGSHTLLFRGEVARYAEQVLRSDVRLSIAHAADRTTAFAVLTRIAHHHSPFDRETEELT